MLPPHLYVYLELKSIRDEYKDDDTKDEFGNIVDGETHKKEEFTQYIVFYLNDIKVIVKQHEVDLEALERKHQMELEKLNLEHAHQLELQAKDFEANLSSSLLTEAMKMPEIRQQISQGIKKGKR